MSSLFSNLNRPIKRSYKLQRENMVDRQLISRGITDEKVLESFSTIERHRFVEESLWDRAYNDSPLPIGKNQTISQPYIVALMTQALELTGEEKILEVGTGSGYQAAILSKLASQVFTIERHADLAKTARSVFESLGIHNIALRIGDGTIGWKEFSPYDGILVTAASPETPKSLLNQLCEGGKLVIPVGGESMQKLYIYTRKGDDFDRKTLCNCSFVPLIGSEGWNDK
ncbi:MAG: protein-L-isoaspartate(D-aspartate) O-methyltransferase [bacterium]|nr:protein-L-isoaspartate(D-aspartate) O-methyltransferase [bacterium]